MKVLCLDGGGVLGVGQALILSQIDNSKWDAVCGTSIGSAVAAMIATGKPINVEFFRKYMPQIFKGKRIGSPFLWPRYSDKAINQILSEIFKGQVLNDAKIPLFITASSIDQHCEKVFCSTNIEDGTNFVCDIVRASCSAQTYFKPWQGYGDGGIFANNPSMIAITRVSREFGIPFEEIELCSIGTGSFSRGEYMRGDSLLFWSQWILSSLFEGGADKMFDEMSQSMPLKKYERYQFVKRPYWKIDNPQHMLEAINDWTKPAMDFSVDLRQKFFSDDEEAELIKLEDAEAKIFDEVMK